ncbi:hypothetical protein [Butyrivibrio sp. WCE2006]|nr:hypothetical protein [Butyrivibrio sp. WCE2006]
MENRIIEKMIDAMHIGKDDIVFLTTGQRVAMVIFRAMRRH